MTANESEATKAKIAKVLALLEGAKTEGEAQAASLALQRLLAKSGLTVEEVLAEEESKKEQKVVETACKAASDNWKLYLATIIAENYRCDVFSRVLGHKKSAVFVGLEDDAAVACGCYYATVKAAQRCFKQYCKAAREKRPSVNTSRAAFKNGYYYGFCEGLEKAYAEQVASDDSLAIVLQTPAIVKKRMDELSKDFSPSRARTVKVCDDPFAAGIADGYGFGRGDRLTA